MNHELMSVEIHNRHEFRHELLLLLDKLVRRALTFVLKIPAIMRALAWLGYGGEKCGGEKCARAAREDNCYADMKVLKEQKKCCV
jgi:hypothetical protein